MVEHVSLVGQIDPEDPEQAAWLERLWVVVSMAPRRSRVKLKVSPRVTRVFTDRDVTFADFLTFIGESEFPHYNKTPDAKRIWAHIVALNAVRFKEIPPRLSPPENWTMRLCNLKQLGPADMVGARLHAKTRMLILDFFTWLE